MNQESQDYNHATSNPSKNILPNVPTQQTLNKLPSYEDNMVYVESSNNLNNYSQEPKYSEQRKGIYTTQATRNNKINTNQYKYQTYEQPKYNPNTSQPVNYQNASNTDNSLNRQINTNDPVQDQRINALNKQILKSSQVKEGQVVKGHSRIQYVPFEQKIIDYQIRQWIEKVPVQRKVIEYEQKRYIEQVPRQVTKIDYYAVEYLREYVPQVVPQKIIEMVPVERIVQRTEYVPIEKQIVHYPQGMNSKVQGQSRIVYQGPPTTNTTKIQGQSRIVYQGIPQGLPGTTKVQGQSRIQYQPIQNQLITGHNVQYINGSTVKPQSPRILTPAEIYQTSRGYNGSSTTNTYVSNQNFTPGYQYSNNLKSQQYGNYGNNIAQKADQDTTYINQINNTSNITTSNVKQVGTTNQYGFTNKDNYKPSRQSKQYEISVNPYSYHESSNLENQIKNQSHQYQFVTQGRKEERNPYSINYVPSRQNIN